MPTADQLIDGMRPPAIFSKAVSGTLVAGRAFDYWAIGGRPGAGSFDNTLNGVVLSSASSQVNGQLYFADPGAATAYLARLQAWCTQPCVVMLCDRLWHNGGITITSTASQTIASPTWPARDDNGTTDGVGVYLGVTVSANVGAGTPTITVGYTNSANTSGRTATNILATVASPVIGSHYEIGSQAGDLGVRSVQSFQLSATWTSGTINLIAYRVLARMECGPNGFSIDALTGGRPVMYPGSVPFLMIVPSTTTTSNLSGLIQTSWV